jgi:pyridinium-3,5-bisthiocarboxylic acid mononucleotide nickel chelatase
MTERLSIHLDVLGGIAGDMFAAAILDALPDLRARVLADVAAVLPLEAGAATLTEGASGGLRALRFGLAPADARRAGPSASHGHDAARFSDLCGRIRSAPLSPGAADRAVAILTILADAESRIHGVPRDEVHFHEIADWDSLMDVVAAGSIAAALEGSAWSVSDLPRGGGTIATRHGRLPVPAPATAAILTGFSFRDDGVPGERVTPTGAAILRHLVGESGRQAPLGGRLKATGTGAGTRDLPHMPNVLRALVFAQAADAAAAETAVETVAVVSFEIDDMTGEEIGVALERLRGVDGVLDASLSARTGKKSRPLSAFHLLVRPDALEDVKGRCFSETSTIGLRWRTEGRACLPRCAETVPVEGRTVRVKRVERPGAQQTAKAESDDLAAGGNLAERRRIAARAGGP